MDGFVGRLLRLRDEPPVTEQKPSLGGSWLEATCQKNRQTKLPVGKVDNL